MRQLLPWLSSFLTVSNGQSVLLVRVQSVAQDVDPVQAYDWNCPQNITPRFTEEDILADISRVLPPDRDALIQRAP